MVQALPVLRLIKRHLPASEIYWWIDSRLAPLLEGDPDLAGVVLFERRRWRESPRWAPWLDLRDAVSKVCWTTPMRVFGHGPGRQRRPAVHLVKPSLGGSMLRCAMPRMKCVRPR